MTPGPEQPRLFDEPAVPASRAAPDQAPEGRRGRPRPARRPRGPFARVALDRPVDVEFTYAVPPELVGAVAPGVRVAVPFGKERRVGVVVALDGETDLPAGRLRAVAKVLDEAPIVDAPLLELTRWMAREVACAWGEALAAILPAPLKRERGERRVLLARAADGVGAAELAALEDASAKQHRVLRTLLEAGGPVELADLLRRVQLSASPVHTLARHGLVVLEAQRFDPLLEAAADVDRPRPESLSADQERAVAALVAELDSGAPRPQLLFGVTGSGKTEVYLRAIERSLERGRGAIVLVPEIALTPQTVGWFRARFGEVAVQHSRLTDAQRLAMWRRVRSGEVRLVVGARSAVFAPVRDLGVIVIDEEHEPSFKQGNAPRYHARDVALERGRREGAVVVLGSATPSLETWRAAQDGEVGLLRLSERVGGGALPGVKLVDLRTEPPGRDGVFSRPLRQLLEACYGRKEQSILFLNRRGFAPVQWCRSCRSVVRCPSCAASITWHRRIGRLVCHLCGHEQKPTSVCPTCTAPGLAFLGQGSERVERAVKDLLEGARVARMDSDTMLRREDYERTLTAFGAGELDVLVGTQMIAKGLDFPRVTLVGIVSADTALHLPDPRAAERTFQLVAQVAGRAGRGALEGTIVVQTESPEHPAIALAARHDYEAFATQEMALRRELGFPPYGRLLRVVLEDEDERRVVLAAERVAAELRPVLAADPESALLGPQPAPLEKIRDRYRRHLLVRAPRGSAAFDAVRTTLVRLAAEIARPRVAVDVDPVSML